MIDGQLINSHVTQSTISLKPSLEDVFVNSSAMDFVSCKETRKASRNVQGSSGSIMDRLKKIRIRNFWQIAPDGKSIERLYDPNDEPLVI